MEPRLRRQRQAVAPFIRIFLRAGLRPWTVAAFLLAAAAPASAQTVHVFVNGDPITSYDIDQRTRFTQMVVRKQPTQKEVIDELIDEKLKVQYAKRFQFEVTEKEVDASYADMAKRMGVPPDGLTKALSGSGVNAATLKAKIKADLTWHQVVRGKFQSSFQFRDKDILAAIETRKKGDAPATGYEYTLHPILFVVARGAPAGMAVTRMKEAEALRSRFNNCDEGLRFARAIRDVAVREPIRRASGDLPEVLRQILDNTAVGGLTPPEVTQQGVELFAVCAKKEQSEAAPIRREVQNEMFAQQFQSKANQLLRDLRRSAMIERVK